MNTCQDGLDLIKIYEGGKSADGKFKAYKLEGEEHYTIGYGHSFDNSITASTVWTQAQADAALKKDLKKFENYVTQYATQYKFTFNENQFSALVSYCYNRGPGGLKELLSHSKTIADVGNNIVVYWGSAILYKTGLVRRRKAEQELFLKPVKKPAKKVAESAVTMWKGRPLVKGQKGLLTIIKPINLWKRVGDKLEKVRILQPDEVYRVYGYDELHGGQYAVGDGHFITKMDGYIKYETPSKSLLEKANY